MEEGHERGRPPEGLREEDPHRPEGGLQQVRRQPEESYRQQVLPAGQYASQYPVSKMQEERFEQ